MKEIISQNCNDVRCKETNLPKGKMRIFLCDCGVQILVVPDLFAMEIAVINHIKLHKQLTGETLSEELLTEKIICLLGKTNLI